MKSLLNKIDHISIVVENIELVQDFFVSLGFSIDDQSELKGEWVSQIVQLENVDAKYVKMSLPGDSTSIELIQYKNPPPIEVAHPGKANTMGYRHIAFQVLNIEEVVSELNSQGIATLSDVQEYIPTKKKLVYFKGPENILLELAQYGETVL